MDISAEVNDYRDIISGHPHFNTAYKKLRKAIRHAVIGNLIFLFGPTGVGKSTLLKYLIREILKELNEETSADASILPIVRIEVDYPSSRQFSWIEFYRSGLKALQEPLIDKKLQNMPARSRIDLMTKDLEHNAPGHALKVAFFNALSKRKVKILLFDEAHHFAKGFEGEKLIEQLEYLKSMANKNNKIIVLAGTYELIAFLNRSGQLSRRGRDVHFPRYKAIEEKEKKQFISIVKAFKNNSPLGWGDEILKATEYLYTYSAGCIGILKEWIDRAHMEALENDAKSLSLMHLEITALSIEQLKKITEELINGETLLEPVEGDLQWIQEQLGVKAKSVSSQKTENSKLLPAQTIPNSKYKRKQVGIRNPKRDEIGNNSADYNFSGTYDS